MTDPSANDEGDADRGRFGRRRFLGTGLAAAGAGLIHAAGARGAGTGSAGAAAGRSAVQRAAPGSTGPLPQLPLRGTFPNLPAIPVDLPGVFDTLAKLEIRGQQVLQAKQGLTDRVTLNGVTRRAYAFLFGGATGAASREADREARRALERDLRKHRGREHVYLRRRLDGSVDRAAGQPLPLEQPEQYALSWTTFDKVYETGKPNLRRWASSLTDADAATRQFWPMIAEHGFGYNLIVPERVTRSSARALRGEFGKAWSRRVRRALADGELYVIDMSRFETLQPQTVDGETRFTPATVTLLIRNPRTKNLMPVAIIVSGHQGAGRTVYARDQASNGAWLYALQAAKVSITVFGVWLGHVYHWHIVTTAMQMAMFNTLPTTHPVYQLLEPQSNYAIAFDNALLSLWSQIAPPTSLSSGNEFLAMANEYAAGRSYFDDDPKVTIKQLGLRLKDFTEDEDWDQYPVVQRLLSIWELVEPYVETFVQTTYASDAAVVADTELQTWIATAASADPSTGGNIRGLPAMDSRKALEKVLTSLVYRLTVHGISRLNSTSNPALTFVPNYPHCLQSSKIPSPRARIRTRELLSYLPNTGSIAQAVTFYFTFAFSTPYEPFVPLGGVRDELFFPGGTGDKRNRALIKVRRGLADFIGDYQPDMPQRFQWPRNIET